MIKVLVVDDSGFMRKIITDLVEKYKDLKVVGEAKNGLEVLKLVKDLKPDVVLMDVQMPFMDGISALGQMMAEAPTPTIILSAFAKKNADITIECLQRGALDFVQKPGGTVSPDLIKVEKELIEKIREVSQAKVFKKELKEIRLVKLKKSIDELPLAKKVVAIASSTGGPAALQTLLSMLPPDFPAGIMIVQHMPSLFTKSLAERLDAACAINVREATKGDEIKEGLVLLAPGGYHMKAKDQKIQITDEDPVGTLRPSADIMITSVAEDFGKNVIGVELTGMGFDGLKGMQKIKEKGGKVIAQDESTSVIYGMPKEVVDKGLADFELPLEKIAEKLVELVGD